MTSAEELPDLRLVQNQSAAATLEAFRLQVDGSALDHNLYPYTLRKARVETYRLLFCSVGMILMILTLFVFFRSANWLCELHMAYCWFLKSLVGSFGGMMGMWAMSLGLRLRTENEVAYHTWSDAKRKLARLYRSKPNGPSIKEAYHLTQERLYELREQNQTLLRQIAKAPFIASEEREDLFNKALSEYQHQADAIVQAYVTG
jgi:hypothetical protein